MVRRTRKIKKGGEEESNSGVCSRLRKLSLIKQNQISLAARVEQRHCRAVTTNRDPINIAKTSLPVHQPQGHRVLQQNGIISFKLLQVQIDDRGLD